MRIHHLDVDGAVNHAKVLEVFRKPEGGCSLLPFIAWNTFDTSSPASPLRLRMTSGTASSQDWPALNARLDRIDNAVLHLMAQVFSDAWKVTREATYLLEVMPLGGFVWQEGRWDAATLLIVDGTSGHEVLEAVSAFEARRDEHGDGIDTIPAVVAAHRRNPSGLSGGSIAS